MSCHRRGDQRHHIGTIAGKGVRRDADERPLEWFAVESSCERRPDAIAELTLQKLRCAAGELDDVHAARDLGLGVGQRLAVLFAQRARDVFTF